MSLLAVQQPHTPAATSRVATIMLANVVCRKAFVGRRPNSP
jgi:hypothetical protein